VSNVYRDLATLNPYCSAGLDAIRGWQGFCNRTIEGEPFIRKDFIEAYKNAHYCKRTLDHPKVYVGIGNSDKIIYFDNEQKIRAMLSYDKSPIAIMLDKVNASCNTKGDITSMIDRILNACSASELSYIRDDISVKTWTDIEEHKLRAALDMQSFKISEAG